MIQVILPFTGRWPLAIAVAVVLAELIAGLALLLRIGRFVGAALSMLLASGFVMVNLSRINEDLRAPCACFGVLFTFSPKGALALDLLIASAAWYLIRTAPSRE